MPEKKVQEEPTAKPEAEAKKGGMTEIVRRVLLAGVGGVVLAQEEIEEFVDRLVDKGEIAEQDGKKLIKEMMQRRRKETPKVEKDMDKRVDSIAERVLGQMNIPTKSEIDALGQKISELSRKVEELKQTSA